MRNNPDRVPEILKVDVQKLEALLGRETSITTRRLEGHDLDTIRLARVIAEGMDEAVEKYMETISNMSNLTDYAQAVEGLDHFNKLGVSPEGEIFGGYVLMQINTDGQSTSNAINIIIDTNGHIKHTLGINSPITQDAINATIKNMLEALHNRASDHRQILHTLMKTVEQQGRVQMLNDQHPHKEVSQPAEHNDTRGKPRLPREEVVARLEKIISALRQRVIELSPQAS